MNKILETLEAEREELAEWRHDFHMHPELVLKKRERPGSWRKSFAPGVLK